MSKVFWHRHTEILKFYWWMTDRQTSVHNCVIVTHKSTIVLGRCTKAMADYLPDECKGMTEHLSEVKEPASMIKTLLRHARIQIEQAAKAHEHAPRQQVLSEAR